VIGHPSILNTFALWGDVMIPLRGGGWRVLAYHITLYYLFYSRLYYIIVHVEYSYYIIYNLFLYSMNLAMHAMIPWGGTAAYHEDIIHLRGELAPIIHYVIKLNHFLLYIIDFLL
jgi:hypothetical protein